MNRKFLKAGILTVLLGVPALIFVILHQFGQNHYDLPFLFPETNDSGEAVVTDGDTVFIQIPEFELTDQYGRQFSSKKMEGNVTVASFFFTRCGTICPKISSELTRVQGVFKENGSVLLMSMSIDPKHDSVSVLNNYAVQYEAVKDKWFFLTGDKKKIYDLAIQGFKLPVADASEYNTEINDIDDAFIHSEKLLLIDKAGFIRGIYDGTNKEEVDRLIVEISVLLDSYKTQKSDK
ncbi:MAG: SCO family protein [Spirosomaceae bacterium]|nr:SCO family protein [Spirosomataceae bacterium]MDP5139868.1 SCO family protein [Spirosomataceae bacterium]